MLISVVSQCRLPTLRFLFAELILCVAAQWCSAAPPPVDRPNVIFFLADDLGVECVGAYGGEAYRTPNLDQLAEEGMRLNHCYAGPSCTPSRVAPMTGKYNHRNYNALQFGSP